MRDAGLFIIRLALGGSMFVHGYPKLINPEKWEWLGSQMMHIGINFGYEFFGFCSGLVETLGGLLFALGIYFKVSSGLLAFTMFIAMMFHINQGDGYPQISHALELFFVFLGMMFVGPGKYKLLKKKGF
jgi:putative oxidoreductase